MGEDVRLSYLVSIPLAENIDVLHLDPHNFPIVSKIELALLESGLSVTKQKDADFFFKVPVSVHTARQEQAPLHLLRVSGCSPEGVHMTSFIKSCLKITFLKQ